MGVKASSIYRPQLEPVNSTNLFEKTNDEDSLQLAFSIPCSPSHSMEPEVMEQSKSSVISISPAPALVWTPSTSAKPMYFFIASNGSHIVLPVFMKFNWQRTTDKMHKNCVMRWTETVLQINYQTFNEGEQMINHIPNCGYFTNKLGLLLSLRAYEQKVKSYNNLGLWYTMKNFVPDTYWIDDASDKAEFNATQKDGQIWIYKPCGLNQGKGIHLVRSRKEFRILEEERIDDLRKNPTLCRPRIIQRYLAQPLLVEGRKFDIRVYMAIACTMPYLVLFHSGYVRVSTRKYEVDDVDLVTHLTNQFVQKKDPNYYKLKEDTVWTMDRLNDYVNTEYLESKKIPKDWVKSGLMNDMEKVTAHCFHAVRDKLACRIGFFEIYGLDFMIDDQMKTWLIEINSNPAMNTNCQVLKDIIPPIISNFIEISIECFEKARRWKPLLPLQGISPLSPSQQDTSIPRKNWSVALKPLDSERRSENQGLPGLFTVLYSESLEMAKIRQHLAYDIPLRLWYPPKFLTPSIDETVKPEADRSPASQYLFERISPSTTKSSPLTSSSFIHSATSQRAIMQHMTPTTKTGKPKAPGMQHVQRGTRIHSRIAHSNLKKTPTASKVLLASNSRGNNINCSVTTFQHYKKAVSPNSINMELPPLPPVILPGYLSSSSTTSIVPIIPDRPIENSHVNNSGTNHFLSKKRIASTVKPNFQDQKFLLKGSAVSDILQTSTSQVQLT